MYTCMCMCIECMQLLHHKARRCYYSYIYCLTNIVLTCLMHSYAYILIYHLCTASLNCTLRLYMYSAFACLLVNKNFIHKIEPDAPSGLHSHLLPGADKNLDHFYTGKVHVCC